MLERTEQSQMVTQSLGGVVHVNQLSTLGGWGRMMWIWGQPGICMDSLDSQNDWERSPLNKINPTKTKTKTKQTNMQKKKKNPKQNTFLKMMLHCLPYVTHIQKRGELRHCSLQISGSRKTLESEARAGWKLDESLNDQVKKDCGPSPPKPGPPWRLLWRVAEVCFCSKASVLLAFGVWLLRPSLWIL